MLAGSVAAQAVIGGPDLILITLTEFAEQCRRICRAGNLPLMVDADHGYGNALNVMRTVEELETAGIAGMSIEDTVLPVGFGQDGPAVLSSVEEGVGRMRAAIAARQDPELVIVGRTSAPQLTGTDDTIRRLRAYEDAGVDALFVVGLKGRDQLKAVSAAVKLPLVISYPGDAEADLGELAALNARICLQPHVPIAAAIEALAKTYTAMRGGTTPSAVEGVAGKDRLNSVMRKADYDDWTKRFMR